MKKFVVAYISFMDNELTQQVVEGTDELSVMQYVMMQKGWDLSYVNTIDIKEFKHFAFDCDASVSAIEI